MTRACQNRKTNVHPAHFSVGDFVIMRRAQKKGHKLSFLYRDPRRFVGIDSELVFEFEGFDGTKREKLHSKRLLLYRADTENKPVAPRLRSYAERNEIYHQVI